MKVACEDIEISDYHVILFEQVGSPNLLCDSLVNIILQPVSEGSQFQIGDCTRSIELFHFFLRLFLRT